MMRRILAVVSVLALLAGPALAETDCSGTVGTTAQYAWSAGGTKWFYVMNNSVNLMCISMTGVAALGGTNCAAGSYPLNPGSATTAGGAFASLPQQAPNVLSVVAAVAGSIYSCTRGN